MLVLHNIVNVIANNMETFKKDIVLELKNVANNMETFKNDICLELKNVAKRERTRHTSDLDLNDIVKELKNETKVSPKKESTCPIQDKMNQDDTVCIKKYLRKSLHL